MSAWTEIIDSVGADSRAGCCADRRKPCLYHEGLLDGLETAVVSAGVRPHLVIEHLGGTTIGTVNQDGFVLADANTFLTLTPGSPVVVFPKGDDE